MFFRLDNALDLAAGLAHPVIKYGNVRIIGAEDAANNEEPSFF
jgi:hypothetical protein